LKVSVPSFIDTSEPERKRGRSSCMNATVTSSSEDDREKLLIRNVSKSSSEGQAEQQLSTLKYIPTLHSPEASPMFHSHAIHRSSSEPEIRSKTLYRKTEDPNFIHSCDKHHDNNNLESWEKPNVQKKIRTTEIFPSESDSNDIYTTER
jgi:hypothetical protein